MQHKKGIGDLGRPSTIVRIAEGTKMDVAELAFKKMLMTLSKKLDGFSLSGFKFLCAKQIPKKLSETIHEPTELWQAMQERGLLDRENLSFLKWMLREATENRVDLVAVVEQYERDYGHPFRGVQPESSLTEPKVAEPVSESSWLGQQDHPSQINPGFVEQPIVPQQATGVSAAVESHMGAEGTALEGFDPLRDLADSLADTMVLEADPESATRESASSVREVDTESETRSLEQETDPEAETKISECVIKFHYPADVRKELKAFYPKEEDVRLSGGKRFMFGRGKNVNVKLNDEGISREQFDIKLQSNQERRTSELVLTNLSKTRLITLDSHDLGHGEGRVLLDTSTLIIRDLDSGAIKFIIKTHLPPHFSGEFKVVFHQEPEFYEHLRIILARGETSQHVAIPGHPPQIQTGLTPPYYPLVSSAVQPLGPTAPGYPPVVPSAGQPLRLPVGPPLASSPLAHPPLSPNPYYDPRYPSVPVRPLEGARPGWTTDPRLYFQGYPGYAAGPWVPQYGVPQYRMGGPPAGNGYTPYM